VKAIFGLLIFLLLASGCATVSTQDDGKLVRHYIGYVRVIYPETFPQDKGIVVSEVKTIGLNFARGIGIGYFHEREERIPMDCRLVVRVTNKEQLDRALEVLKPIAKENLCAVIE
jgi:hypothetical protein